MTIDNVTEKSRGGRGMSGELIKAPGKALQSSIAKANEEHKKASDGARATIAAKNYAIDHAIACGKALLKAQAEHKKSKDPSPFGARFLPLKSQSKGTENCDFDFIHNQGLRYMKLAKYPSLARAAMLEDDAERFNLDRTYSALSNATAEEEKAKKNDHRIKGTGKNEWYTPEVHIEAARTVLGRIDLDPASSQAANEIVKAGSIFTADDDGLAHAWSGSVWMNPPYSQPAVTHFARKLIEEYSSGNVTGAIALTHNYTDTVFFQEMLGYCSAVCFTRGRIAFVDQDGNKAAPTQGQAFTYFGDSPDLFSDVFSQFGRVLRG